MISADRFLGMSGSFSDLIRTDAHYIAYSDCGLFDIDNLLFDRKMIVKKLNELRGLLADAKVNH